VAWALSRLSRHGFGREGNRDRFAAEPRAPAFAQLEAEPKAKQPRDAHGEALVEFVADEAEVTEVVPASPGAAAVAITRDRNEPAVVSSNQAEGPIRLRVGKGRAFPRSGSRA